MASNTERKPKARPGMPGTCGDPWCDLCFDTVVTEEREAGIQFNKPRFIEVEVRAKKTSIIRDREVKPEVMQVTFDMLLQRYVKPSDAGVKTSGGLDFLMQHEVNEVTNERKMQR